MLGTHSDITGRKQAEVALLEAKIAAEESRAQYEQVVSMISDIVWRYDVDLQGQFVGILHLTGCGQDVGTTRWHHRKQL